VGFPLRKTNWKPDIEAQPYGLPSKAFRISSGNGWKNFLEILKRSFASPIGRLVFLTFGRGRISATGMFRFRIIVNYRFSMSRAANWELCSM
jgi:hypothetical protein